MIAKVEAVHGRRFALLAELLGKNQYFENPDGGEWMCMNCGHIQKEKWHRLYVQVVIMIEVILFR